MKKHINLLPPSEQKQNLLEATNQQLTSFGAWLVVSLISLVLILLTAQILLSTQLNGARATILTRNAELKNLEETFLQEDIKRLNTDLANFQTLRRQDLNWSGVFQEFARLLPRDVRLDKLSVSREKYLVVASGHAGTRDSVLALRRNLLDSEYFRNINFPLSNLEKPTDLDWSYQFYINQEKLR